MMSPELSQRLGVAFTNLTCETVEDLSIKDEMIEWLTITKRDLQTLEDLPDSIRALVEATETSGELVRPSEVISNG